MFANIIPAELTGHNHDHAAALAAGAATGSVYEQAATGMLLRLPPTLVFRPAIVGAYYPTSDPCGTVHAAVRVWWAGLGVHADGHRLPTQTSEAERSALMAACWVSGHVHMRVGSFASGLDDLGRRLWLAAIRHALGVRVRGTEDGDGSPVPDGVDGHPVNGRTTTAHTIGGAR